MSAPVTGDMRYSTREDRVCPVCGGGADDQTGTSTRCWGFMSGSTAWCTREEFAKGIKEVPGAGYPHKLTVWGRTCPCGTSHSVPSWWPMRETKFNYIENGQVVGVKQRIDWLAGDKDIRWVGLNGRRVDSLPLFGSENLDIISKTVPVVVCEGEKKVRMLAALGIPAVGVGTGAPATHGVDAFKILLDRPVILWGDIKDKGPLQQQANAARLSEIGHSNVTMVPPGTPAPDDFIDAGNGTAQIERVLGQAVPITAGSVGTTAALSTVRGDQVKIRAQDFKWYGWLPTGKVVLMVGDPDDGKTAACIDLSARKSRGAKWPDGTESGKPETTLYLTAEDDYESTLMPRYLAAGGDRSRIYFEVQSDTEDTVPLISLETDIARIEATLRATGAKIVVIDVVNAYLPKVDTWKDSNIRSALRPLAQLAAKLGVLVIGIMHLNKKSEYNALQRVTGGIGYVALSRSTILVVRDKVNPARRLFCSMKMNLAPKPKSLAYTFTPVPLRDDDGAVVPTFKLTWEDQPIDVTAEQALRKPEKGRPVDDVVATILRLVTDTPVLATEMLIALDGIAERTIDRAKVKAGVTGIRYADGPWYWAPAGWKEADRVAWREMQRKQAKPMKRKRGE
jgi:putative DNA primase/helicase